MGRHGMIVRSLVVTLLILAPLGCRQKVAPPSDSDLEGGAEWTAAAPKKVAPDFELEEVHGTRVRLSDSAGKVRLVDFWATWCAPCREEIPDFKYLHATYSDRGFVILAISMDDEGRAVLRPFVEENQIPYTNLLGNDQVAEAFGGVVGFPTAFLLDQEGNIVESFIGPVPKSILEKKIRELLKIG